MVRRFQLEGCATELVIGAGACRELGAELARRGLKRPLLLTTPTRRGEGERLAADLVGSVASVLAIAAEHVPSSVAQAARSHAVASGSDSLVPVGGGSTIGLAKAVALDQALPIVAIPTTYSGSEMTPVWGVTTDGVKRTGRSERVRAACVLYDPELSRALPPAVAVPSAFNAIAHSVEALYAKDAGPLVGSWAEEGVRRLVESLPALASGDPDLVPRESALHGACLSAACLGAASMGLHHQICHVLGGTFGLPHAAVHTAVLPYVARYNLEAAPAARRRLCRALHADDPAAALHELARSSGAVLGLGRLGLAEDALPRVVEQVLARPYPNPRELTAEALSALLRDAYSGDAPAPVA